MNEPLFIGLILLVAFAYAMVGHGGASGYLALMTMADFAPGIAGTSALMINLVVSAIAFTQYARAGHFNWSLFWPFAAASVPMAWYAAHFKLEPLVYKRILAACLLFAVLRLFGLFEQRDGPQRPVPLFVALVIGAVLGTISGLIGIGGGILLSPILLLMRYADTRITACTSALFIFVNSLAGLAGKSDIGAALDKRMLLMVAAAICGGIAGSYIGARRLPPVRLRHALGAVLLFACINLWWP